MRRCRFQYSLCRIVYCCLPKLQLPAFLGKRFNIRSVESCTAARRAIANDGRPRCFNIRSVESCTAAIGERMLLASRKQFQYSLCRIVYCCKIAVFMNGWKRVVSIFALSNRVLLPDLARRLRNVRSAFQYSLCRIVYCCHRCLAVTNAHDG